MRIVRIGALVLSVAFAAAMAWLLVLAIQAQ